MSRLGREKREQQGAVRPVLAAAPIDVLVGAGGASVGGVPVTATPGEEIQNTVLNHLHRIALATGHPVHATIHDDRIGYVVALRIDSDGSSHLTAEPVRTAPPGVPESRELGGALQPGKPGGAPHSGEFGGALQPGEFGGAPHSGELGGALQPGEPGGAPHSGEFGGALHSGELGGAPQSGSLGEAPRREDPREALRPAEPSRAPYSGEPVQLSRPTPPPAPPTFAPEATEPPGAPTPPAEPIRDAVPPASPAAAGLAESDESAVPSDQPPHDKPTHLLRQTPEPPTFPLRAVPDPDGQEPRDAVPTFRLRAVPEWVADAVPGTVAPPTGQFGPPPVMDAPVTDAPPADARPADAPPADVPVTDARPELDQKPAPAPEPTPLSAPASAPRSTPKPFLDPAATRLDSPDPKPTPPRGFDAVAEAVLGDDPATAYDGGGAVFLVEPMARINEAVKAGRIDTAAQTAERTVVEATRTLGAEHPEVLRLLELTAYIAYLAGDPARAFGLSLDLAKVRHRSRDGEAAYGNVQSAATAWRAVRDPEQGLRMGVELIGLWTELTMEDGPAAEDIEQLESARTRMGRLAERARKLNP